MQYSQTEIPLVSVIIATYNSACTIIETLNSIYDQDYDNIELVVSDDSSKDDTIAICSRWIEEKGSRFKNVQLLTVPENTGVAVNFNRAVKASHGVWIKTLAGDDLLAKNCVKECVEFVTKESCQICMVRLHLFDGDEQKNREKEKKLNDVMYSCLRLTKKEKQYKKALYRHILPGPGIFYSRFLYDSIGGFDERFCNFEEYSFELRVFEKERVFFLDKELVWWRQRANSLTHTTASPAEKDDIAFFYRVRKELLKKNHQYLQLWDEMIHYYIVEATEFKDKSDIVKCLWFFSPLFYYNKLKKLF